MRSKTARAGTHRSGARERLLEPFRASVQPEKDACQFRRAAEKIPIETDGRGARRVPRELLFDDRSRPRAGRGRSRSTPGPSAPLIAAASAEASPAATSQPFRPVTTLSGSPPALVATTARRWAMASSVTSELPSYSVGCTNSRAALVPRVQRRGRRPVRSRSVRAREPGVRDRARQRCRDTDRRRPRTQRQRSPAITAA